MPSQLHEALIALFRNRPTLAPELLHDALHLDLPEYTEARIESAQLNNIQPAEYRADLVVLLYNGRPALGIVVEIQLSADEDKRYVWPVYVASLRARFRCPVCLLVVTTEDSIARWAGKPIELGGGNCFVPCVLAPSGVPEVIDKTQAELDPELSVLSAMAHGSDPDLQKSVPIAVAAIAASSGLDPDRSMLYFDLVLISLTEAARRALQAMNPAKYEFQSEFARHYIGLGKVKGEAALLHRLLLRRFGQLPDWVEAKLAVASEEDLLRWGEGIVDAKTLDQLFAA